MMHFPARAARMTRAARSARFVAAALFLSLWLGGAVPAVRAQEPTATPEPPPVADEGKPAEEKTEAADLEGTVGEIRVTTFSIFDPNKPGEDKWYFRLANRLHRTTRPGVVRRQLLFETGDPYSHEELVESERILRANRYLHDAKIRPVPAADGVIDLEVETRDVWTLRAGISFNRAGGENSTDFTLQDANFLGTGKDLTLWRISNVDRTSTLFRYRDPNVLGTRAQIEISAADYSDGGSRRFEVERPFYSLDSRWAAGFKTFVYDRIDSLYDRGEVFQKILHDHEKVEAYLGFSSGLSHGATRRWLIGYSRDLDNFEYPPGGDSTPLPPENRLFSYPWIGFDYVEDGFIAERQLDQITRTEDLNIGTQARARLGYSTSALGAKRDHLIASTRITTGWKPGSRQLLLAAFEGGARWGSQGRENVLLSGLLRYYVRDFGKSVFYVSAEGAMAENLDPETQLLLGGDNGLRGYPLRYLSGDRRWLVTLEQRFFGDKEYFHVLNIGAAAFFDAGRAWFEDGSSGDQKVLRDVGLGLRLGSSRSSSGTMVHFDLAYPLDRDEGIESLQWLVSTSETF